MSGKIIEIIVRGRQGITPTEEELSVLIALALGRSENLTTPNRQLVAADSNTKFTNAGASERIDCLAPIDLDDCVSFTLVNCSQHGFRFVADTGRIIRQGDNSSPVDGHIETTDIGASLTVALLQNDWFVISAQGAWNF